MESLTYNPESTSASLIERACQREAVAWNRLSAIYGPLVYRWCRRAGLQEADAADVLQEVFRALTTGIENFRVRDADGGFRGWLYGITRHKLMDHYRRRAKQEAAEGAAAEQELVAIPPEPDAADADDERTIVLHAALEQIRYDFDEHNWQAFYRTAIGEEAAIDVAADLGLSPGAVRQAKYRVLRRLRREMEGL